MGFVCFKGTGYLAAASISPYVNARKPVRPLPLRDSFIPLASFFAACKALRPPLAHMRWSRDFIAASL